MAFQCSRCGEKFGDLESFLQHMQEVHDRVPVDTGEDDADEGGD